MTSSFASLDNKFLLKWGLLFKIGIGSVISACWAGDNERLYATKPCSKRQLSVTGESMITKYWLIA